MHSAPFFLGGDGEEESGAKSPSETGVVRKSRFMIHGSEGGGKVT